MNPPLSASPAFSREGRKRLFRMLYPAHLFITLAALAGATLYFEAIVERFHRDRTESDLVARARLFLRLAGPALLSGEPESKIDALCKAAGPPAGVRLSVVLPDGRVIGDSETGLAELDNQLDRPEIAGAFAGSPAVSTRHSRTSGETMMYYALPVPGPGGKPFWAVRAALPLGRTEKSAGPVRARILAVGAISGVLAAILIAWNLRRVTGPVEEMARGAERFAQGDLANRLVVPPIEEIGGLAETINEMAARLDERIRTVLRQRNEQEAVLASMDEGVLAVDAEERIINMNQAAARLLGVDAAGVKGRGLQEAVRNPELQRFAQRALSGGEPVEAEIVLRDRTERLIDVTGRVLHDEAGKAIGALVVMNDLTRLRRLETVRRDFVANVSHELKTPITSIKGFVETLLDGALENPADARRFLEIIAKQSDRLNAIIEDLLSLSRIEQEGEKQEILLEEENARGTVRAAMEACAVKAAEKQIRMIYAGPEELRVNINPPLLEQALVNLIDNAIKYSEAGSEVRIEGEISAAEVRLRVRDQGPGIPAEHIDRIFERFYRVDKARSRKLGGTGLGLAIVKHIAQAHHGRVAVESASGGGSSFTIALPRGR